MPRKYLMVETKDKRKFFTDKRNLNQLIEFSKIFGAEISVVKADEDIEVLDLISLAETVCEGSNQIRKPSFQILEVKVPRLRRPRKALKKNAKIIESWIKKRLLSGGSLSLSDVSKKYKKLNLTLGCFCQHFKKVRLEFGDKIEKVGKGRYRIK